MIIISCSVRVDEPSCSLLVHREDRDEDCVYYMRKIYINPVVLVLVGVGDGAVVARGTNVVCVWMSGGL